MTNTKDTNALSRLACEEGFDPIEDRLRANIRSTIEAVFTEALERFLGRLRYGRDTTGPVQGYRHGHRDRRITGTFGTGSISVPRARIEDADGKVAEWRSRALPRYQRLTKPAEALIASVYLSGPNTRPGEARLVCVVQGAVSKDVVCPATAATLPRVLHPSEPASPSGRSLPCARASARHRDNVPCDMPSSRDNVGNGMLCGKSIFEITDAFRSLEYATARPLLRPPQDIIPF